MVTLFQRQDFLMLPQCMILPLLELSGVSMTPCNPLQVSRTPSILWTIKQDFGALHSIHGPIRQSPVDDISSWVTSAPLSKEKEAQ